MFYVKIPISIYDERRDTLFNQGYSKTEAEILKSSIESWFEREDEHGSKCVQITMKSGHGYTALCDKHEFRKRLANTYTYVTIDKTSGNSN